MAGIHTHQVHPYNDDEFDFDQETASTISENSKELHYRKRLRRLYLVAVIVLFLTVGILVFSITIFHINAPKFRIRSIDIEELSVSSSNTFDMKFEAELSIKNSDFGYFDFEETSVRFFYRGAPVALDDGGVVIEEGKVKARSTKKISFSAEMGTSNSISPDDIQCRCLTLTCNATMNGTVHLMKLIKRRRSSEMNCTININLYKKVVLDIKCK
ncbi:late embryogenesis abundant protein At1g64065-like [Cannabis sativa]|uniref:late embryogenesis abundant protein At1g64065-like n=1 Tax=Cannabis sativa TaxID=3483 RepID=UPI0029CA76A4|nr:late embryogenesis abundant protein At1g64065-like [Cannabis sativa]